MHIDPELPWGCWMRIETRGNCPVFVDDASGTTWPTIRSAFWTGRLGMPECNGGPPAELLERLHAVLAAVVRRTPSAREQVADLFEGSAAYRKNFHLWLASVGLVTLDAHGHGANALTAEGLSVLLMLSATRPYDVREERPSAATINLLSHLGLGTHDRDQRFDELEMAARQWHAAFLRREEGGSPSIILSMRARGPMPALQTVWSLPFDTKEQRDDFYEWLCLRLDRWRDWADLASSYGSQKLTHKLLAVLATSLGDQGGRQDEQLHLLGNPT